MNKAAAVDEITSTSLMCGAELWAPVAGELVRRAASPPLSAIDQSVGGARAPLALRLVEPAYERAMPTVGTQGGVTAMAWPVLDRGAVTAVAVIYLSVSGSSAAAVEVWAGREGRSELCLQCSAYTGLDRFAKLSPHIGFPKSSGMPGRAWATGLPQVIDGLSASPDFMRGSGASDEGLDLGLSIPLISGSTLNAVALLMSGVDRPIARVVEVWRPGTVAGSMRLVCAESYARSVSGFDPHAVGASLPAGDGWIGRAWATRLPELIYSQDGSSLGRRGAAEAGLTSGLALPLITLDDVRSVVVLMW